MLAATRWLAYTTSTPSSYVSRRILTIQAADLLVNAGLGFGVGVVASVLLFRRECFDLAREQDADAIRTWMASRSIYRVSSPNSPCLQPADCQRFGAGVAYSNVSLLQRITPRTCRTG